MRCESSSVDGPKILRPRPRLSKRSLTTAPPPEAHAKLANSSRVPRARSQLFPPDLPPHGLPRSGGPRSGRADHRARAPPLSRRQKRQCRLRDDPGPTHRDAEFTALIGRVYAVCDGRTARFGITASQIGATTAKYQLTAISGGDEVVLRQGFDDRDEACAAIGAVLARYPDCEVRLTEGDAVLI